MAEDNKIRDLNREYWGRVHDMCDGTDVKPWECFRWKYKDRKMNWASPTSTPIFDHFTDEMEVQFAVAILKDDQTGKYRPVWVGDRIYPVYPLKYQYDGSVVKIIDGDIVAEFFDKSITRLRQHNYKLNGFFTWHPPKPRRTFTLNSVELPCPISDPAKQRRAKYQLDIAGSYFYYDDAKEFGKVAGFLEDILTEARDKQ